MNSFKDLKLKEYTLFIDRDGVINEPIVDGYALRPEELVIPEANLSALKRIRPLFKYVILVTNQQGIGKELMSIDNLEDVHMKLMDAMENSGVPYFDAVFYAPYLRSEGHAWRKPSAGMMKKAFDYFPDIDKSKLIMVGDSPGDMAMARSIHALAIKIHNPQFNFDDQDLTFNDLTALACELTTC